jgi:hypothetical protein
MSNDPTILTRDDIEKIVEKIKKEEYTPPLCDWCHKSYYVRLVGVCHICYDCEKKERKAERPIIQSNPIKMAYFAIKRDN